MSAESAIPTVYDVTRTDGLPRSGRSARSAAFRDSGHVTRTTFEESPLGGVARERCRGSKFAVCRGQIAAAALEFRAGGRIKGISLQTAGVRDRVQRGEPALGTVALADRDRAVERHDR